MALVQNGIRVRAECVTYRGHTFQTYRAFWGGNKMRNMSVGQGITDESCSIPDGNQHPQAWFLATRSGGLAARDTVLGSASITVANLAGGLNADAALTGSGDITNAQLELILFAVAAITASGSLTAAITGKLEAVASLAGQGDVTAALGALASAVAALTGSGTVASSSSATAQANISADIVVTGTGLNTSNVAFYVWNALAASFNTPGTFGAEVLQEGDITKIADILLRRSTANIEASSDGDALALRSLYGMIAQAVHNTQVSGTALSVAKSDDTTVLGTRTVTLDPAAQPITGLNSD
jgi:hypothetical protein